MWMMLRFKRMIVQGLRDLQPADERECRDVLIAIGDHGQLALKVANVRFKVVTLSYLDSEKVAVVSLSLPAKCVLGKEHFRHLIESVERMQRSRIEPI